MRSLALAALMLFLVVQGVAAARAETRVALVIGNSDYVSLGALANPASDAALMTKTWLSGTPRFCGAPTFAAAGRGR